MSQDPHEAREAQKYEKPIPSREFILNLLEVKMTKTSSQVWMMPIMTDLQEKLRSISIL